MDLSDLEVSNWATVHGVFVGMYHQLNVAVKITKKWFNAKLTDEMKVVRTVSFASC